MATKIISGTVEGIRSLLDRSLKMTVTTQEISPSDVGDLFSFQNKFCKILITDSNVVQPEIVSSVESVEVEQWEKSKSPGQRLRSILFLNFTQNNEGMTDFDNYYKVKMNQIIEHYKSKLV